MASCREMPLKRYTRFNGLHGYWYTPKAASSAIVICHGVHQHGGFYNAFAQRLASEGYAALAYDLRGFGKSEAEGERGMAAEGSFGQAVEDLRAAIAEAQRDFARVFVFGHSLGGLIACLMATRMDAPNVTGYILSSPSVAVAPALRLIGPLLRCVPGATVLARYELDSGSDNPEFKSMWQTQPAHLCDPARPFKAAYVRQARKAQLTTRRNFARFEGDALLLSGALDFNEHDHGACADLHKALAARREPNGQSCTLKVYPNKKHELIFEDAPNESPRTPNSNEVVDDIVAWLKAPRAAPAGWPVR